MKNTNIGFTQKFRLTALALLTVFITGSQSAAAFAQSQAAAQSQNPKASLFIEQKAVRFDLQGAARAWQLEVFNQPGDLIYSSGVVNQSSVEWAFNDQQEKPLADGLYVYSLKFWDENNQPVSVQRGHVIINRASSADRVWVTSNNSTAVGSASELTVVAAPDSTVAGTKTETLQSSAPVRQTNDSAANAPLAAKDKGINLVAPITGEGIIGRIAKFTGANLIDESVIAENAGNVQIGTALNEGRLNVYHPNMKGIDSRSPNAQAVYGQSFNNIGVEGVSTNNIGLSGSSAGSYGIHGTTNSAPHAAVYGTTGATNGKGVWGRAHNGESGIGVFGESNFGRGVLGKSSGGTGVRGESNQGVGVRGESASGAGVSGYSNAGNGVYGNSLNNHGTQGRSTSANHAGVYGETTNGNGVGVIGQAPGGPNQTSIGVYGIGGGWGTIGVASAGHGVAGFGSNFGASIYGASGALWAGFFDGNVEITGILNANSLSARMDHPIDPANKYLNQSFVESSEMLSVQAGNATTDANGEAIVSLPEYFQAMNGDFRYQLTVVGQFAQAIVAQKIEGNVFKIKTDKPNVEVSWQVTGVRQDAAAKAARKSAEELKPESERGRYLRPELFGQPAEKSIERTHNSRLMESVNAARQSQAKQQQ